MNYTIGSDPEVMLKDGNGDLVPAERKFKGTKTRPFPLTSELHMQVDNVNLEYNTTPTDKEVNWLEQHQSANQLLTEYAAINEMTLAIQPTGVFKPEHMKHPSVWVFGCEPDFNVWTQQVQRNPTHPNKFFRSAGGHVHLGVDIGMTKGQQLVTAMYAELLIGAYLAQHESADDVERRVLYGRAGSIRFKPYGIEYRSPGNVWLKDTALMSQVFNRSVIAVEVAMTTKTKDIQYLYNRFSPLCQAAINEHNPEAIEECDSIARNYL